MCLKNCKKSKQTSKCEAVGAESIEKNDDDEGMSTMLKEA